MHRNWEPYEPGWLIELARDQRPEEPWLAEACSQCTLCFREPTVTYFAEYDAPGASFDVQKTLCLTGPAGNTVVVTILEGQRIGAVEAF